MLSAPGSARVLGKQKSDSQQLICARPCQPARGRILPRHAGVAQPETAGTRVSQPPYLHRDDYLQPNNPSQDLLRLRASVLALGGWWRTQEFSRLAPKPRTELAR